MFLAFPSFCGDFRLEPDADQPDERSVLTVDTPTPAEIEVLKRLEKTAVKKGWTEASNLHTRDKTVFVAKFDIVGAALFKLLGLERRGALVAVAFEDGKPRVTEIVEAGELPRWLRKAGVGTKAGDAKTCAHGQQVRSQPKAAAVIRAPRTGCPVAGTSEQPRAAQVLLPFLNADQRRQWDCSRSFICHGEDTGRTYLVAARDTVLAGRVGRCVYDVEARMAVCAYDWGVAPEEEVLGLKLFLEHREKAVNPHPFPEADRHRRRFCAIPTWA